MALGNPSKPSGCSNHELKQKLKREHHLKGALRNQLNKHQNSQKPMLKAEQKIPVACLRQKNNVFAHHLLASRRQGAAETIADYLQALKNLSEDGTFTAVSAQQYKEQLIGDSFINGVSSAVYNSQAGNGLSVESTTSFAIR